MEAQVFHRPALYFRAAHHFNAGYEWNRFCRKENLADASAYPKNFGSNDHYVHLRNENPDFWKEQHARFGLPDHLNSLAQSLEPPEDP